ncbi:MAG: hypothetical protein ACD_3C00225G0015 [uncultured bacterium (gcode 4)]|uniref:PhnB-like domain-containing protein n=1 Tax=uncultured bacterium (gcode 4) TaxID=1234023 RepID=K2FZF7_9BACT|nr:MAG: hypothetical protein ACD_3C00225G0015 [uncultured bacterium (gcode 4)]
MKAINPYLNFAGNTEEAFNFYKSIFGWEFSMLQRFKDTPDGDKLSDSDKEKIMHVALPIWNWNMLMWTDSLESMWMKLVEWNNYSLTLEVDSKEEADKIFKWLSEWWQVEMAMDDAFWWAYFWMFKDKFWISWMVNYTYPK